MVSNLNLPNEEHEKDENYMMQSMTVCYSNGNVRFGYLFVCVYILSVKSCSS